MDTLVVAMVLVAALVMGIENKPGTKDSDRSIGSVTAQDQSGGGKPTSHGCGPAHNPIIQRDLTEPRDGQARDDEN